jgi:GT2 family glycosyltransferase
MQKEKNKAEQIPKVHIVILNWNQRDMTVNCLNSLEKLNYDSAEIVLVDNGSTDDSLDVIKEKFPEITLIKNRENLGVAGGRNVGLRYALQEDADYILFLDNDTIVDKDFLIELVKVGEENEEVGIITGKIYFYDEPNKIWSVGGYSSLLRSKYTLRGYQEIDTGQYDKTEQVDQVQGCCLMVKREVIDKIGLFDERFVRYFAEDVDLCIRTKKEGYKIYYAPRSKLWHHIIVKTTVSDDYWYLKGMNLILLRKKYFHPYHWVAYAFFTALGSFKFLYREIKAGNFKQIIKFLKGAFRALGTKNRS